MSERSLRYYEQQGLLAADRTAGGQRDYPERAVDRVIRIQELFAAGLHSHKIAQLLSCMRDADGGPSELADAKLVTDLTAERARIDRMIADLTGPAEPWGGAFFPLTTRDEVRAYCRHNYLPLTAPRPPSCRCG